MKARRAAPRPAIKSGPTPPPSLIRSIAFRVAAILLPLVVLAALEGVLRLAGVDRASRDVFRPVRGRPEYLEFNPLYVRRYFPSFQPSVAFDPFERVKRPTTLRVFALGASSTAGFPYAFYHGFPARLEARIQQLMPLRRVEVINLGVAAINSFALWDIKDAIVMQKPDAIVIYAGHNEYYGAFGAGGTINRFGGSISVRHLVIRLKRLVLFRSMERLLTGRDRQRDTRTMMARAAGKATIPLDGQIFRAGVEQYSVNMRSVVRTFARHGIAVYVGTLVSNLRDQHPLGDAAAAISRFDDGRRSLASGDTAGARAAFVSAKEADDIRFRAPEAINDVIRSLQRDGATVVDVQGRLRETSRYRIEGDDLFTDHVHPTYRGYDLIAETFLGAMGGLDAFRGTDVHASDLPAAVDPLDAAEARLQVARLKEGYPYKKGVAESDELQAVMRLFSGYLQSGSYADSLAAAHLLGGQRTTTTLLSALGRAKQQADTASVLLLYRSLLDWQPFSADLMAEAVKFALVNPRFDPLTGELARFAAARSGDVFFVNVLAMLSLRRGALEEGERFLDEVERIDPRSIPMLITKARLLAMKGDAAAARGYLERYRAVAKASGLPGAAAD